MKKFILLFIIILIAVFSYAYEFKLLPVAGNSIEWSNIAQYKDSVYYHISTNDYGSNTAVSLQYIVGDTAMSAVHPVSPDPNSPYNGEIATDSSGRAYIAWFDTDSTKTIVSFIQCNDTTFSFYGHKIVDSFSLNSDVFHTNLVIDATNDGKILIAYNKVYAHDSGGSTVLDSVHLYYSLSEDYGFTFSTPEQLEKSGDFSIEPDVAWAEDGSSFHIIYTSKGVLSSNYYIYSYASKSPFDSVYQNMIDTVGLAYNPSILCKKDGSIFATYACRNLDNNFVNIKMKTYSDINYSLSDTFFINRSARDQRNPQMTMNSKSEMPLVAYYDSIDNNTVAMFAYHNGSDYINDWMLWTGQARIKRPEIIFVDSTHVYFNLLVPDSSDVYSYICSAKPDKAPGAPENMKVNGDTVSYWYDSVPINVSWDNPFDYSSILRAYVKVGNPPAGNNDTTFTLQDTIINFNNPYQGATGVYVWLKDYKGNVDYNNFARIDVKYDTISPDKPPLKIIPADSAVVNSRQFNVVFRSASDNESGIEEYKLEMDTLPAMTSPKSAVTTDTVFTVDTSLFTAPFMDRRYFWNVTAYDSAGNAASGDVYSFLLMATRRVNQIYPAENDTVKDPVECTINAIKGYDAAIEKYRFVFATDSILSTIIIDTVIGSSFSDTVLVIDDFTQNTVYWTVSAVNKAGTETAFSDTQRFYLDNFIDSIDPVITRLRPFDGAVVNNSRPVIRA
ncbi:MAG: hypothetical protein R6U31_07620, partial [bacterium]